MSYFLLFDEFILSGRTAKEEKGEFSKKTWFKEWTVLTIQVRRIPGDFGCLGLEANDNLGIPISSFAAHGFVVRLVVR